MGSSHTATPAPKPVFVVLANALESPRTIAQTTIVRPECDLNFTHCARGSVTVSLDYDPFIKQPHTPLLTLT